MVKPSEFTPNTASLIKEAVGKYFDESEFAVFLGGPEVGAEFTALPLITFCIPVVGQWLEKLLRMQQRILCPQH